MTPPGAESGRSRRPRERRCFMKIFRSPGYHIRSLIREEDAISTVEIILIIVVLIALVVIFRDQLTSLVRSILAKITTQANGV